MINIETLQHHLMEITTHSCLCEEAQKLVAEGENPLTLKSEINRCGLFSILMAVCQGCKKQFPLNNSNIQENGIYDINLRAVWGTVSSGGGCSNLNEMLGTMNMPPMSEAMFTSLEEKIGLWWHEVIKQEMAKAGAEERRIAIEKGNYHQGVPAISVVCDGGWSKRTHKHTYNAFGGVAVIFGLETNKLLYMGVRNKFCGICKVAENKNTKPKEHNCYLNWKESSQAMETDIILNGFLEAEVTHGVRYLKVIADGDSSMYATLQEKVPVWGKDIKKLECANHICKCVRANLEKLVEEKHQYKGKGKLTKLNRIRLTTAIRCAIKMRSPQNDAKQLRKDILNSIYHILGYHENCSDFCKNRPKIDTPIDENEDDNVNDEQSVDVIFEVQSDYWKIPSESEMESSRYAEKNMCELSEQKELIRILNRVAEKSDRLIGNFTTNLAESWMAIRSKFDGGKVINRCSRGSWNTRCYGGALRKNLGTGWSPVTFQTVTETPAGIYFHQLARRQTQKLVASKKYKAKPESKVKRRKRKIQNVTESNSKKAKIAYGSNLDDSPDVNSEKLKQLCETFMKEKVTKTDEEIKSIENDSIEQSNSDIWKKERHVRLTSSNFGKVISRRSTNVSGLLVERMLYSKFKGNLHTIRGLSQERHTITEYENKFSCKVTKTGLRICSKYPCLGASTDGIVHVNNDEGLLEIKNLLQTNTILIKDAPKKIKNFCLEEKDNKLMLKRNHEIFYQIQGQLNIFEKDWCDLVIRRMNPYDIFVERVYRDSLLWETEMVPKLTMFYEKFLLPELALPRYGTYTGIRKPLSPWIDTCQSGQTRKRQVRRKQKAPKNKPQGHGPQQTPEKVIGLSEPLITDGNEGVSNDQTKIDTCQSGQTDKKKVRSNPKAQKLNPEGHRPQQTHEKVIGLNEPPITDGNESVKNSQSKIDTCQSGQTPKHKVQSNPKAPKTKPEGHGPQQTPEKVIGLNEPPITDGNNGVSNDQSKRRSRRQATVKFLGRDIRFKGVAVSGERPRWRYGTILDVVRGKDGAADAVYEILYQGDDQSCQVTDVLSNYQKGLLQFTDL